MKTFITFFLLGTCLIGYAQASDSHTLAKLKQEILHSNEVIDWQNAVITYQKSNLKLCSLIEKQKLNTRLVSICGKHGITKAEENFALNLFRTMRITDELKESKNLKEKVLRVKFPQLTTHFGFDEIFPELYAPIQKAREEFLKKTL